MWEHGNIGQFWKGTREHRPPVGDPLSWLASADKISLFVLFMFLLSFSGFSFLMVSTFYFLF